ncbi:hypothetical protein B0H16DRAFT_1659731 [Mycena metata]|uniref:TNT domain-containing protein n=1 Tax=Mycena metata TaxID=1033252 RepID=A0AAD7NV26_9AGAR|nr:hypothetical protein B0H16DRAFT_1659731 [Mycena metata]
MFSSLLAIATALAVSSIPTIVGLPTSRCNCQGTNFTDPTFFCGDSRLGPAVLPTTGELGVLLNHYDRLGGLCPGEFLAKWTLNGTYQFPPINGFQISTTGMPIEGNETFVPGMLLDRFGHATGGFLAPADTPFSQRSLPPSSLGPPTNYHIYRVEVNNLTVLTGTIAPWFSQPGQGTQYELPEGTSVQTLLDAGILTEIAQ